MAQPSIKKLEHRVHHHLREEEHGVFQMAGKEKDINTFIDAHPLASDVFLAEADFWTLAQAGFLKEGWAADANWVTIIDELNIRLHA